MLPEELHIYFQLVRSEVGVKNIKAWIDLALCPQFRTKVSEEYFQQLV